MYYIQFNSGSMWTIADFNNSLPLTKKKKKKKKMPPVDPTHWGSTIHALIALRLV